MIETLKYNWTTIRRFHCKEGYIDKWTGDMGSNPDSKTAPKISLNAFITLYRINDGEWFERLPQSTRNNLYDDNIRELFTAEEIIKNNYEIRRF